MKRIAMLLLAVALAACSKDGGGPGDGVSFPDLPSGLLTTFCHRGNAVLGDTRSGMLSPSDCDAADIDPSEDSYYEIWRVRVAATTTVTFDANSSFDNYLTVLRLNSYTSSTANLTVVGENDDRTPGSNFNALVTVTLQPNTDYFVSVSGYDYTETGPYTLQIR
jgi:hypothetical protein